MTELYLMLKRLYISNFALIGEMDVTFPGGLTVITGETGAGKSIFLEALGLALGKRADRNALRNQTRKCIVEAEFEIPASLSQNVKDLIEPGADSVLIRREIGSDGRSRCFVNDSLTSVSDLKPLAECLVSIHSQHQTLLLNQPHFQIDVIDAYAGNDKLLKEYSSAFFELHDLRSRIAEFEAEEAAAAKEQDFLAFQFEELNAANLTPGAMSKLEEESLALSNSELIKATLQSASFALYESDENVSATLGRIRQSLSSLKPFGSAYEELYGRVNALLLEARDISADAERLISSVVADPARLEQVNDSLDRMNRLLKKHQAKDENALIAIRDGIASRLDGFAGLGDSLNKAKREAVIKETACRSLAEKLHASRAKAIPDIQKRVVEMLRTLSMPHADFRIEIAALPQLTSTGSDSIKFLFSANKGQPPAEVSDTASGGELSRLMLSLKALIAKKKKLPAIIFDEIDTGVSGEVADRIGNILSEMGKTMQVIVITHLPQMASKGNHHLFVYKEDSKEATESMIRPLSGQERVNEIAKMLSAGKPTQTAVENARELLQAAG